MTKLQITNQQSSRMRILSTWLLVLQISSGIMSNSMNPNLQPSTDQLLCPGDNITYTCQANDTHLMLWSAEPHFSTSSTKFRYTLSDQYYNESYKNMFFGNLTGYVGNVNNSDIADTITTTMTVITSGLKNVTNITCSIFRQQNMFSSSSLLYIIEKPNYVGNEIETSTSNLPVVLELGEMFDGRGVPIDHYTIQLDNGTQLKTANSTYSFDIMYNTTLSVNISAHNCAGYSPFFPLVIQHNVPATSDYVSISPSTSMYGIIMPTSGSPEVITPTENSASFQDTILLPLLIGFTVLILFTLFLITLLIVYRYVKKRSKKNVFTSATRIRSNGNSEHNFERTPSLPMYSYVPVMRDGLSGRDCTGQYHTVSNGIDTSHEVIGMYAELQPTGPYTEVDPSQSTVLPPPTVGNDIVEYTMPDISKLVEKERTNEEENVVPELMRDDLHPLDKEINAHLILLQMGPMRESWHALGLAAGMDHGMLNSVDKELGDDSGKLAEVVFYWVERMKKVYWSDVAQLCEQIGFNQISEAINNAYVTGVLPLQDDTPDIAPCTTKGTLPPTIPPHNINCDDGRRHGEGTPIVPTMVLQDEMSPKTLSYNKEYDEASPPPPPLPPPLAPGDIDF